MAIDATAQFEATLVGTPLNLAQANVVQGSVQADGLTAGTDFSVNHAAGTVTILRALIDRTHVLFRFQHNNAPVAFPTPPAYGADADDINDMTKVQAYATTAKTFLANGSPTQAETLAQVRRNTRAILSFARYLRGGT